MASRPRGVGGCGWEVWDASAGEEKTEDGCARCHEMMDGFLFFACPRRHGNYERQGLVSTERGVFLSYEKKIGSLDFVRQARPHTGPQWAGPRPHAQAKHGENERERESSVLARSVRSSLSLAAFT